MIIDLLRAADPARDTHPDPDDANATRMVANIVAVPRAGRPRRTRLIRLGWAAVAAAAAATVALSVPWPGHQGAVANAVTVQSDGSVAVTIGMHDFAHPDELQRALDRAGVPATVLTKPDNGYLSRFGPHYLLYATGAPPSARCGAFTVVQPLGFPAGGAIDIHNVQKWHNTDADWSRLTFTLHPDRLVAGGRVLIGVYLDGRRVNGLQIQQVIGTPTCLSF